MKIGLLLTLAVGTVFQIYYYSQLPDRVVSNFGNGGEPNSWMSKEANLVISLLGYFLNTFLFLGVPLILKKSPIKYINWPKREYWFAEERRAKTLPRVTNWLHAFGLATNVFILFVTHCVYVANRSDPIRLHMDAFFGALITYAILMLAWIVALYVTFNKTEESAAVDSSHLQG